MTTTPTLLPDRPSIAKRGRIVAVASGKGGVGKTWFAITLAHALARRGRRVLLGAGVRARILQQAIDNGQMAVFGGHLQRPAAILRRQQRFIAVFRQ